MKTYVLSMLLMTSPLVLQAKDKSCGECCGKHHTQKAADVQFKTSDDNATLTHHAYYLGGEVITVWSGPDLGKQEVYILGKTFQTSTAYKIVGDGMVHYYDGFKICSNPVGQWIRNTKK